VSRTAVIIGAGPAGLTAALELLRRTDVKVIVLERSHSMGGIARTVQYKGNRIDIGGHRFFSKSDRVMEWWLDILPLENSGESTITYQRQSRSVTAVNDSRAVDPDRVMLIRARKSRIYYLRRFFDYPISLNLQTVRNLGLWRTLRIGLSYSRSMMSQIRPEETLEQFMINRFGRELYGTFFKSYTEKVWGVPCNRISAEWGAQRIKGLSVTKAILHAIRQLFVRSGDLRQKGTETSLIEKFMYPKYGPGQLWETVAEQVIERGGQILTGITVDRLRADGNRVTAVETTSESGARRVFEADYVFSTMPVKELIHSIDARVPANVKEVADGLAYRDFMTVGLLLKKLTNPLDDTWLYIQEPDVLVGRVQIFNNWSPALVADPSRMWLGLEYFCYDTDAFWKMDDAKLIDLAASELHKIGLISKDDVLDGTVVRMPKAYPAYFGTHARFHEISEYLDRFENLFLVGRNGMHKYNNQDHSMLTAMEAVDAIAAGSTDKSKIWAVNTETEYHESK
jgi:protoporphyrinogen oxidase